MPLITVLRFTCLINISAEFASGNFFSIAFRRLRLLLTATLVRVIGFIEKYDFFHQYQRDWVVEHKRFALRIRFN